MNRISLNLAGLALSALLVSGCSQASSDEPSGTATTAAAAAVAAPLAAAASTTPNYGAALPDFTALVDRYGAAVVNVSVVEKLQPAADFNGLPNLSPDDPFYDFFKRFRGIPRGQQQPSHGVGSGFIITPDGYILTNAHVVADASEVRVRMNDRREMSASVVGIDRRSDVAVIKVDAKNLPTVTLGDPSKVKPGEWVVAIGSPFGLENSVTAGIVSATSRSLPNDYVPFIQTDVPVNPGNSGGPLFNMRGEVIGINSQIYSQSGGYMGISFAIPIDVAVGVKDQLVKYGKVSRGRIGVTIQDVNQDFAESFGLDKPRGALVSSVERDGPAAKAGIEPGDVILKVNAEPIERSNELPTIIAGLKPGTSANIEVFRKGANRRFEVKIAELQEEPERLAKTSLKQETNRLGLSVRALTGAEQREAQTDGKLVVENVSGPAAQAGVQPGDVILGVNGSKVATVGELAEATNKAKKSVALLIERDNAQIYIPVRIN